MMFKSLVVLSCLFFMFSLLSACSSGGDKKEQFLLRDIPKQYAKLSLPELQSQSSSPAFSDLQDNIDTFNGDLVAFEGLISDVFEGSQPGIFQIYVDVTHVTETAGTKVDTWRDSMLLLYSISRGPKIEEGDMVQFAGTVHGIFTTKKRRSCCTNAKVLDMPTISVIKAELVTSSK